MINIKLSPEKLVVADCIDLVTDPKAGAICTFIGTVRNETKGQRVIRLVFEAYATMAISEMDKIAQQVMEQFDIQHIAIHHRVGELSIGDIPVIIVASAAHRKASFLACEFAIDALKQTVPIWKKEFLENGAYWVSAHP